MNRIYADFKGDKCPNDQLIWIFDCQKHGGISVSPQIYAERFGKEIFDNTEGEYLAIIFALEQPDYVNDKLEILNDSSAIDVLKGEGRVNARIKPYVDRIRKLRGRRNVRFSKISRDQNLAGYKAEGHPCDKKLRDIERDELSKVKEKDGNRAIDS
jgi:hypothetical protein